MYAEPSAASKREKGNSAKVDQIRARRGEERARPSSTGLSFSSVQQTE